METYPKHFLDLVFWPFLKIIWEPLSKKGSHWWQWRPLPITSELVSSSTLIPRYFGSRSRTSLWSNFWQTNFGWQGVALVCPEGYKGKYQIGYIEPRGSRFKAEICSVVVMGKIAVLRGPEDVLFFAFSYPAGERLELKLIRCTVKRKIDTDIIL